MCTCVCVCAPSRPIAPPKPTYNGRFGSLPRTHVLGFIGLNKGVGSVHPVVRTGGAVDTVADSPPT